VTDWCTCHQQQQQKLMTAVLISRTGTFAYLSTSCVSRQRTLDAWLAVRTPPPTTVLSQPASPADCCISCWTLTGGTWGSVDTGSDEYSSGSLSDHHNNHATISPLISRLFRRQNECIWNKCLGLSSLSSLSSSSSSSDFASHSDHGK